MDERVFFDLVNKIPFLKARKRWSLKVSLVNLKTKKHNDKIKKIILKSLELENSKNLY